MTQALAQPANAQGEAALKKARVLVVDDDAANREGLSRRLLRRGFDVASAADGVSALAAIEAAAFDLVILDVMMPGMSGLEVLSRLRLNRSPSDLPVIMATAKDASEDVVEALRLGANDYVTKPLDFAVLLARMETHLSLRKTMLQVMKLEQDLSRRNVELEAAVTGLKQAADRARQDLELAAKVQATFLPTTRLQIKGIRTAWHFAPCVELAGDALNLCRLDDEHLGFYVLDVSGHGVAASLTAVAAARVLAPGHDPASILMRVEPGGSELRPTPPAAVMDQLAKQFEWNSDTNQFLTVFYGLLHIPSRQLTYASAGHPPAIVVKQDGSTIPLHSTGLPVGISEEGFQQNQVTLDPGDRLYLYSDGVMEAPGPDGDQLGIDRLSQLLCTECGLTLDDSVRQLHQKLETWRGGKPAKDDVSVLAIETLPPLAASQSRDAEVPNASGK